MKINEESELGSSSKWKSWKKEKQAKCVGESILKILF